MSTPALDLNQGHDALLPRPPGGLGNGAALALLAHAVLLLALTQTVQWRTREPEVYSAELWAAVPQAAAPLPSVAAPPPVAVRPPPPPPIPAVVAPPPPPPVRDADIATEKVRQERARAAEEEAQRKARAAVESEAAKKAAADKAKVDAEAKKKSDAAATRKREADAKKAEEDKRKQEEAEVKAEDEKLAKQRQENLRRMMGQAGTNPAGTTTATTVSTSTAGTGGTGAAAQGGAPSADYAAQLRKVIRDNLVFTGDVDGNPSAEVEVRTAAGGSIMSRRLVKSSGNKDFDEAVLRAIDKTATLPRNTDGRVPPAMTIVFRPKDG